MKKIVTLVSALDDLALADGREEPADVTVEISYHLKGVQGKGPTVRELDLSQAHKVQLDRLLQPWLEAGRYPAGRGVPRRTYAPDATGIAGSRASRQAMRDWADTQPHLGPDSYTTPSGHYYYSKRVKDAWAKHLAELDSGRS